MKTLGDESRINIYNLISNKGKLSVSAIVKALNIKQPTVSYHLHEMQKTGLLTSEKQGKNVFYITNKECPIDHSTCMFQK